MRPPYRGLPCAGELRPQIPESAPPDQYHLAATCCYQLTLKSFWRYDGVQKKKMQRNHTYARARINSTMGFLGEIDLDVSFAPFVAFRDYFGFVPNLFR